MENKIDMTGKERLLKLTAERKCMRQAIHSQIHNSKSGMVSYDMLYEGLELVYGENSSDESGKDAILKGVLDNLLWLMIGNEEVCEHTTESGVLYSHFRHEKYLSEKNAA